LITQIEHIDAIRELEMIVEAVGMDGTLIGPYDLSCSMRKSGNYDRQDAKKAVAMHEKVALQNMIG